MRTDGFEEISFESTRTLSQPDFERWLRAHDGWDPNHYELLSGRIVMTPPAGYPHGKIEAKVVRRLAEFVESKDLGEVYGSSQGYELGTGDTLEPDASFVSNERLLAGPAPEDGKFLRVVPDLVVEILSPSTRSRDRGEKRLAYARAGVRELWLVDARAREVLLFVRKDDKLDEETVLSERDTLASTVLMNLTIPVKALLP